MSRRIETALLILALILVFVSVSAFSQSLPTWQVTYQYDATSAMGDKGREGLATFMVRNAGTAEARNVVLRVLPGSPLALGPQNSVQVGDLKPGQFVTFQARLVDPLGLADGSCVFQLVLLTSSGSQILKVTALEVKGANHE